MFGKGIESIEFPSLAELCISFCPGLTTIVRSLESDDHNSVNCHNCDDTFHLFCNQKVTLGRLKNLKIKKYNTISNMWCNGIPRGFFRELEELEIFDCVSIRSLFSSSIAANLVGLKELTIIGCRHMEKVIANEVSFGVFPVLEFLKLSDLPNLEEIWDGSVREESCSFKNLRAVYLERLPALKHLWKNPNQNVSVSNLCEVEIYKCSQLRNLFSLAAAKEGLLQLKKLEIKGCEMMEHIFINEEKQRPDGRISHVIFPRLELLELHALPSLMTFCKGIHSIEFPLLCRMEIKHCSKLAAVVSCTGNRHHPEDSQNFHLFHTSKVAFESLEELIIESCERMKKVIANQEKSFNNSPFPNLNLLKLKDLPELSSFCEWKCVLDLPSLEQVQIHKCLSMESFTAAPLRTPNLVVFKRKHKEQQVEDLNSAIQTYIMAPRQVHIQ